MPPFQDDETPSGHAQMAGVGAKVAPGRFYRPFRAGTVPLARIWVLGVGKFFLSLVPRPWWPLRDSTMERLMGPIHIPHRVDAVRDEVHHEDMPPAPSGLI